MKNSFQILRNSVLLLSTVFLLNSCTSNDTNSNKKNEAMTEKTTHKVDTVIVKQMQFNPAVLNTKIGDTIIWVNNDLVSHDITSDKPNSFYSDTLHVGQSWKMAVKDSAGYHCSIHPTMLGKIVVK